MAKRIFGIASVFIIIVVVVMVAMGHTKSLWFSADKDAQNTIEQDTVSIEMPIVIDTLNVCD